MKLLLDLQACQSESRFRGIGRYSYSLASNLAHTACSQGHHVSILLNKNLPCDIDSLNKFLFGGSHQIDEVKYFSTLAPIAAGDPRNEWRLRASELLREYFVVLDSPDILHVSTLIADGWSDNCVASIGEMGVHIPTALTHYDMIPLVLERDYMPQGSFRDHYMRRLESVKRADLLLAISDYSRDEAIRWLDRPPDSVVSISAGVSNNFHHISSDPKSVINLYGLEEGYLLYAPGGFDSRKNIANLIKAFAGLGADVRCAHPMVIVSRLHPGVREHWLEFASNFGLKFGELIFTDYVPDDHLVCLYSMCHCYVMPSLHEGFGMPVLEAMLCGVPVIGSNVTSIPEAVGLSEALFDPYSVEDITNKLNLICTNEDYYSLLKNHSKTHPKKFSWARSANLALNAIERTHERLIVQGYCAPSKNKLPSLHDLKQILDRQFNGVGPTTSDWSQFEECFHANKRELR